MGLQEKNKLKYINVRISDKTTKYNIQAQSYESM